MPAPIIVAAGSAILGKVVEKAITKAVDKVAADKNIPIKVADAPEVAGAVIGALSKDPQFVNATNSELWWQSGVMWGLSSAQIGALMIVIPQLIEHHYHVDRYEWSTFAPALLVVTATIFGLIRRFVPGLKPLFSAPAK